MITEKMGNLDNKGLISITYKKPKLMKKTMS